MRQSERGEVRAGKRPAERGSERDPPRPAVAASREDGILRVHATFPQFAETRAGSLPLLPDDGAEPPSNPRAKASENRRRLAVAEVRPPAPTGTPTAPAPSGAGSPRGPAGSAPGPASETGAALLRRRLFSPIHRCFCSRTITFRFVLRGDSAPDSAHPPLSGGQPGLITAPGRFGRPLRPPGHSRGVLVQCLGKGDASAMAVAATTRFSGRAFWVALGATSDRGRMDRHCRRAGEAPNTVRRWRES